MRQEPLLVVANQSRRFLDLRSPNAPTRPPIRRGSRGSRVPVPRWLRSAPARVRARASRTCHPSPSTGHVGFVPRHAPSALAPGPDWLRSRSSPGAPRVPKRAQILAPHARTAVSPDADVGFVLRRRARTCPPPRSGRPTLVGFVPRRRVCARAHARPVHVGFVPRRRLCARAPSRRDVSHPPDASDARLKMRRMRRKRFEEPPRRRRRGSARPVPLVVPPDVTHGW
jgi:hypothetical protein